MHYINLLPGRCLSVLRPLLFSIGMLSSLNAFASNLAVPVEDSASHWQLTYNWQKHPAYQAAYSGPTALCQVLKKCTRLQPQGISDFDHGQGGSYISTLKYLKGCLFLPT